MLQCFGLLFVFWCEQPVARAPAVRCPPIIAYDRETQSGAAKQLRSMPPGSPARKLVADYGDLRARCRALESDMNTGG